MIWPVWLMRDAMMRALAAVVTGLLLAVMAPWDSRALPFAGRLLQYLACAAIWEVCLALLFHAVRRRWGAALASGPAVLAGCCLVAAVPATAAMLATFALAGDNAGPWPAFFAKSLLLGLVIAFARRGMRRPRSVDRAPVAAAPEAASPSLAFLRRHAPNLGGARLIALQAEDHYLRIHTDIGSALVLLRLRDAAAELEGAGWQPHRSFWLAHGAPGRAVRRGQAWQVVLDGGLLVPVSKPAVAAMRAAGYAPPG